MRMEQYALAKFPVSEVAILTQRPNRTSRSSGYDVLGISQKRAAEKPPFVVVILKVIATSLLDDEELAESHDLVNQTVRVLNDSFDSLVRTVQIVGESIHTDELSADFDFWRDCSRESGRGYRNRINGHNQKWFEEQRRGEADARVIEAVEQKWTEAVETVRGLLAQE